MHCWFLELFHAEHLFAAFVNGMMPLSENVYWCGAPCRWYFVNNVRSIW